VNDEAGNSTFSTPGANQSNVRMQRASKRLRLQMAVSEYRKGKWSPRRISKEYHESSPYPGELLKKFYRFYLVDRSEIDGRFGIKYEGWSMDS
ncbi:hypothetical protein, partial [Salmonella sp. SAL4435]|uniref:hypothetical protein n=1 Tax=Salmonella sp. SAL4435 TaxID=3159890 RepID=UPI003978CB55